MVDQIEDGKIDVFERVTNAWMKISRGDIADRFDEIHDTYLDVAEGHQDQIEREHIDPGSLPRFPRRAEAGRGAGARGAEDRRGASSTPPRPSWQGRVDAVRDFAGEDPAERARLELARDEKLRAMQDEDKRYQIAKDLSDNLTVGYNTSEVIMARLMQTTNAKERVYQQAVSFFSTNEAVLTALRPPSPACSACTNSTETLNEMKEGVSKTIEVLSEIGGKVQEAALKAGYGPTIRADAVKKLVDSVVSFQERSGEIIAEMRDARHQELRGDPRRRRGRQEAHGASSRPKATRSSPATHRRERLRPWPTRDRAGARARRQASSTTSCSRWTWSTRCATRRRWSSSELGQDARDEALKTRLREIYESQGIDGHRPHPRSRASRR